MLHRVSVDSAGPVDSLSTDGDGRYRFHVPAPDTAANYLVSVRYRGIAYFTEPFPGDSIGPIAPAAVAVYDTASGEPRIDLAQRHLVVRRPEEDGSRRIIELLVLANRGQLTRVAPDSAAPVWTGAIPGEAVQFEVGQSEVNEAAVTRRGDSTAVTAPLPPGERQILVSYVLPASVGDFRVPVDQPIERLNVMVEDTTARVEGPGITLRGDESLDEMVFRRFAADSLAPGTTIWVRFSTPPVSLGDLWWVVVVLAVTAMGAALYRWWRRAGEPLAVPAGDDPDVLAARIAALDAEYRGREDTPDYRRQRDALKARLAELLARGAAAD